jgi:hypothetical protein
MSDEFIRELEEINAGLERLRAPAAPDTLPLFGSDGTNAVFSQILGVQLMPKNVTQFREALNRTFHVDGGKVRYAEPALGLSIHSGGVASTGEPASMQVRVAKIVSEALPLLDSLKPLTVTDAEDSEAIRTLVRSEVKELAALFTAETLVPQRIDLVFRKLMRYDPEATQRTVTDPDAVRGLLGKLRKKFALTFADSRTLGEEQTRTRYLILVGYIDMLQLSWHSLRSGLDRTESIGSLIQQMHRILLTLRRAVRHFVQALEAEWIGHPEQMSIELDTDPAISIAALVGWIDHLASPTSAALLTEGREAIRESFLPTARQICGVIQDGLLPLFDDNHPGVQTYGTPSIYASASSARMKTVPAICCTEDEQPDIACEPAPIRINSRKARRAARFLSSQIATLYKYARMAATEDRPVIAKTCFFPPYPQSNNDRYHALTAGMMVRVQVQGERFEAGATIALQRDDCDVARGPALITSCGIEATVLLPDDIEPGPLDLHVANVTPGSEATVPKVIYVQNVYAPPPPNVRRKK